MDAQREAELGDTVYHALIEVQHQLAFLGWFTLGQLFDELLLIGHGGASLLVPHVSRKDIFSLLLHASRSWRIGQVMERFGIARTEAEQRVRQTDELRRRYVQHFFSTDLYDAHNYDLVLDTERTGMPAAIEIALTALRATAR